MQLKKTKVSARNMSEYKLSAPETSARDKC